MTADFEESRFTYDGHHLVHLRAGFNGVEHVVPPAGEDYAFDVKKWKRRVEVSVSPAGRSVRVWVDGKEIK